MTFTNESRVSYDPYDADIVRGWETMPVFVS
jgi:hypothetical protein